MTTPIAWGAESADRRDDPVSGARIIQLTSAAAISNNVYGEQPYTSPDGKRVVIARCQDFNFDLEGSLLVHELDTLRIAMVVRRMRGVRGVFNAAWSGLVHYWTPERRLMRLSLMTLEQKEVFAQEDPDAFLPASSVSPDQRYVIGMTPRLKGRGAPVFQIVRLDLKKQVQEVIFEHPEICNPHLQFNPVHGRTILVQNNVGVRLKKDGSRDQYKTAGCKLFQIDRDGRNQRYVPAGPPITHGITGHECYIADTGRVLFSAGWCQHSDYDWRHDPRHPRGNLFTARPGDRLPTVFDAPQHRFNHVCASRCGRYFVADSHTGTGLFENGRCKPVSLIIGNLETGKFRTLVQDTEGTGGGNQCTHTHPYLTADNRHVIYNADPGGIPQVFAARLPPGFLESLG
jgi:hypothetical protein